MRENNATFRTKMIMLSVCNGAAEEGYGSAWSRRETTPVPMLTENHDGVKF